MIVEMIIELWINEFQIINYIIIINNIKLLFYNPLNTQFFVLYCTYITIKRFEFTIIYKFFSLIHFNGFFLPIYIYYKLFYMIIPIVSVKE